MNTIEVKNLKKYFGTTRAVDNISFEVSKGEIFGFLGPNGAGKTTTIRAMMDFLRSDGGEIILLGENIVNNPQLKNKIGYLSGDVRLYDGWTGFDHIQFLEKIRAKSSIADQLASQLDLNLKVKFRDLSSGNKQKLGLVLAMMFEPELVIMDEPTVGLDPLLQNKIYEILQSAQKRGTTVFMSSHNLSEVEKLCQRVGVIKNGKLITIESIQSLKDKRMHVVKIQFSGPVNASQFEDLNIQIQKSEGEFLQIGIRGDLNPLVKRLSEFNVKELEITHASLEDIFLEFYNTRHGTTQELSQNKDELIEIPKLS